MADNDQSKVRYDDFVSQVHSDPANPQATIMLAGYAGAGPEGYVRIYPDPTLGNWYDVPHGDVVHSMAIPDSKLGGSYVWIRSSSAIKPGSATAAAAPQGAAAALQAAAPAAAPAQPQQQALLPTPATHCFICPPLTEACNNNGPPRTIATVCTQVGCNVQSLHCPSSPVLCDTPPHTPATVCTQVGCPPQSLHCPTAPIVCDTMVRTAATACTQVGCYTPPVVCIHPTTLTQPIGICPPTQPVMCGILPPTIGGCTQAGCVQGGQPQGQAQAMAAPAPAAAPGFSQNICAAPTPSAVQHCGQPPFSQHICPTPSAVHQCGQPPFSQHICPTPSAVHHCGQPQPFTQHICPTPSAVQHCGQPTVATVCTHTAFHTQCICPTPTVTANIACLQTANTPCFPFTLGGCTPQSIACTVTTPIQNGVFNPFGQ